MELQIDPEFHKLIPPLTPEEYTGLEASILSEGCRDAIIQWNGIIIDGHNRYEICQKHKINFRTGFKSFENHDAAKEWIIRNQFGRRNLCAFQRTELAIQLKPFIQERAKENQGTRTDILNNCSKCVDEFLLFVNS